MVRWRRRTRNQIYIVTLQQKCSPQDPVYRELTCPNSPTRGISRLAERGIPVEHYINLGYDDGLLEFEDRRRSVEARRLIAPYAAYCSRFDPGRRDQRGTIGPPDSRVPSCGRGSRLVADCFSKVRLCKRASQIDIPDYLFMTALGR